MQSAIQLRSTWKASFTHTSINLLLRTTFFTLMLNTTFRILPSWREKNGEDNCFDISLRNNPNVMALDHYYRTRIE